MKIQSIPSREIVKLENQSRWTSLWLALTMIMAPAFGVPSEELLQDTFKSILVTAGTLAAGFTFLWFQRDRTAKNIIHPLLIFPLLLSLYAAGSMLWSHTFLAGVEASRWFILTVLLWVTANSTNQHTVLRLVWGIHIGATIASLWTALQFWIDLSYFPQGPNPASTFVNRNFFAEYAVTALPFSIYLLLSSDNVKRLNLLTIVLGFNIVTILMSGTRSALIALILLTILSFLVAQYHWRYFKISKISSKKLMVALSLFLASIVTLGFIPTSNKSLVSEFGVQSPIARAMTRTASIARANEYSTGSFSIRSEMWKSTIDMIKAHPFSGIGAGAWEVSAPIYQRAESQVEADFYAHNEFLQLIAEYGVVGWIVFAMLSIYLFRAAIVSLNTSLWQSGANFDPTLRVFNLLSVITILVVSNAGFPFRLASTGGLFIVCLGMLISSDMHIQGSMRANRYIFNISKTATRTLLLLCSIAIVVATYCSTLAVQCESRLVRAVKLALTITNSGQPNNPHWDNTKSDIINLLKEGIAINPHYRKITPMAADEMATWGDWKNAIWVWDSVLQSRPYVIAISANIAKGYLQLGDIENAKAYLEKAASVQPSAPTVRSLRALIFAREGNYTEATTLIRGLFKEGIYDYDLVFAAYTIGNKAHDLQLVVDALQLRLKNWPEEAVDTWMKLGEIYSKTELKSDEKALFCFRMAIRANQGEREQLLLKTPLEYRSILRTESDGMLHSSE